MNQEKIKELVENRVYENKGRKFIRLGNYALNSKNEYEFCGWTKTGKVKLKEHYSWPITEESAKRAKNRYGNIKATETGFTLWTDGWRYSERFEFL